MSNVSTEGCRLLGDGGGWAASVHNQHLCNVPDMLHFKLFQTLQRVERYHHVRTLLAEHEHVQSLRWKHNIYRTAKKKKKIIIIITTDFNKKYLIITIVYLSPFTYLNRTFVSLYLHA